MKIKVFVTYLQNLMASKHCKNFITMFEYTKVKYFSMHL